MGFLLDSLDQQRFDIQRNVVKNERRQSYENRPYGMAHWHIQEALFPLPHPYHWMTIGSQEDLDAATVEDAKAFFRRFYSPSNSSLAIAGDIDKGKTLELVERYFGDLPPGPPLSRMGRYDSDLPGRVELTVRDKVLLPRLYIAWPTPPHLHRDDAPLELLRAILADGLNSRLHRALVYEKQIARGVGVRHYPAEISGQFVIEVTAAAGQDLKQVEAATDAELERLRHEPPTEDEIVRVKNGFEAAHYRQLARMGGFSGRADQLNHFNVFAGDPDMINTSLDNYLEVQRDDVQRVLETLLDHPQVRLETLPEVTLKPSATTVDRTAMPGPAGPPTFTPPTPIRGRLSNGLAVVVVEKRDLPIVSFGLLVLAGGITDPPGMPGIAAFTAQMLDEGTQTQSSLDISSAFEFIGAHLSTDTAHEFTSLSTETLTRHWPQALALIGDIVKNPVFPEHEFQRIRREHLTDLRRLKDDPTATADRLMPGLLFGQGTSYGHPVSGTETSVKAFQRDALVSQLHQCYRPENATLIVVGDIGLAEVMDLGETAFGEWKAPRQEIRLSTAIPEVIEQPTIYLVDKPGAAQSVIRAGHLTVPRKHPDYLGLSLLNYTLGGQFSARLNQNLREGKGYTYGFRSWINWYQGPSSLLAGGSVHTAVTKESVQEVLNEFGSINNGRPISHEEFEGARDGILRGYPAAFERPAQVLNHLAQLVLHALPDDYLVTFRSRMEALSLDEINRIGRERIQPKRLNILVVGDRQVIETSLLELGLPLVHLDSEGDQLIN